MLKRLRDWCSNHKTIVALIVTALFVLVHIPVLINHEIWADEAISWELSKEITPTNIYSVNSAEPYPLLWQVILAPFSKAGFPVITMNIIALTFVALAVFLFLRFAPMGAPIKLIFIFSSAFFFYNPIIARSYALIPLALCFVCLAYKNRAKKPFLYGLSLAFLAQTHFLVFGLLIALLIGFVVERICSKDNAKITAKKLIAFGLPVLVSIALTIPIIINSFANNVILNGEIYSSSNAARPSMFPVFEESIFGIDSAVINIVAIILLAIFILGLIAENVKIASYTITSLGFWFFVFFALCPSYSNFTQKCSVIFLLIFGLMWVLYEEGKEERENPLSKLFGFSEIIKYLRLKMKCPVVVIACIFFAATTPQAIGIAISDLNNPYSNSTEISEFVNKMEGKTLIIIADTGAYDNVFTPDVRAKLDNKEVTIYNMLLDSYDDYGQHLLYDNASYYVFNNIKTLSVDEVLALFDDFSKDYENIYYITASYHKSCDDKFYIPEYLMSYEFVQELNTNHYLDSNHNPVSVYKIK